MSEDNRPFRVFLCHSSGDKPTVRELYRRLDAEGWIDAWLDEEKLYPGQDWSLEIEKAVEVADVIIVCLTQNSVTKEGYIQRELRYVLDQAEYKPEDTLFIIPVRLEQCEPPRRIRRWQYADYFPESNRKRAFERLLVSLRERAQSLGIFSEKEGDKSHLMDLVPPKLNSSTDNPRSETTKYGGMSAALSEPINEIRIAHSEASSGLSGHVKIVLYSPLGNYRIKKDIIVKLNGEVIYRTPIDLNSPSTEVFDEEINVGEHEVYLSSQGLMPGETKEKFSVQEGKSVTVTFFNMITSWKMIVTNDK